MRNNEKYNIFSMYNADENQKGKKSLGNCSYGIANISNVHERNLGEVEEYNYWPQRKSYLKYKKEDVNKIKSNINKRKYNEQMVEKYENIIKNNLWNMNMEKENYNHINNMNYNDISKNLTEKELRDGLNSLTVCPSKEDLRIIWAHTLGVAKGGLDDVLNMLKGLVQKCLDNGVNIDDCMNPYTPFYMSYPRIWDESRSGLCRTVANEEAYYSKFFFRLINSKHTLDDVLEFIYSFLEHFDKLKKELREYHQEKVLRGIAKILNEKKKKN
ncbi:Plasmodium exported protein (PHIST), unknown function [Plasmodium reichenowi]|uniref:Plasmodium RESA N-terminal domain-containing protein n=1 Tax=Plasmodium reichenowi TaxID=5854 RepID=A0A2P9DTC2_PLARE|nr:Plasmodium exported protein (PHIST), unknown function [Plasmodium reichenowi]